MTPTITEADRHLARLLANWSQRPGTDGGCSGLVAKDIEAELAAHREAAVGAEEMKLARASVDDLQWHYDRLREEAGHYARVFNTLLSLDGMVKSDPGGVSVWADEMIEAIKRVYADTKRLDRLDREAARRNCTLAVMERRGEEAPIHWAGVEWGGERSIRAVIDELGEAEVDESGSGRCPQCGSEEYHKREYRGGLGECAWHQCDECGFKTDPA